MECRLALPSQFPSLYICELLYDVQPYVVYYYEKWGVLCSTYVRLYLSCIGVHLDDEK